MADTGFSPSLAALVKRLHGIGALKFGSFKLKSGIMSPVYVDLRVVVSHMDVMDLVATELLNAVGGCEYDLLCGVPYTALPFATLMAAKTGKPMLMRRKEVKDYGTKKAIEGAFAAGQRVLIVEDLVTSGLSVFETVAPLEAEHLVVQDIVVLLDRGQGGRANVETRGKRLHAVTTLEQVVRILHADGLLDAATVESVMTFLSANQVVLDEDLKPRQVVRSAPASYAQRAEVAKTAIGRELFALMEQKKTNLCLAVDATTGAEVLRLAELVGPHICVLKTHCDIVTDWTQELAAKLSALAKTHGFLIFEDRKFADIGNTVIEQCCGGVHRISSWAHFVNAHSLPGAGIIAGLQQAYASSPLPGGLLLLAQMSTKDALFSSEYTQKTVNMAETHAGFVFGFIALGKLRTDPVDPFIYMTPGVQLQQGGDDLGQTYSTPEHVVGKMGSDVIIVGRGIYRATDPAAAALAYREAGWQAYEQRLAGKFQ